MICDLMPKEGIPLKLERHNIQAFRLPKEDSGLKRSFPGRAEADNDSDSSSIPGSNRQLGRPAGGEEMIKASDLSLVPNQGEMQQTPS